MPGVRPPQTIRVPGTGPTHPVDNAVKRQLARVPQQPPVRSAAQSSIKNTTPSPSAPVNGGGTTPSSLTLSTNSPAAESAGASAVAGTTGLASDAGHVHALAAGDTAGLADVTADGVSAKVAHGDHTHKRDVKVASGGTLVGIRNALNFVSGATVTDDPANDKVDITITSGVSVNVVTSLPSPSTSTDNGFYRLVQPGVKDILYFGMHNAAGASRLFNLGGVASINKFEPGGIYTNALESWLCNEVSGSTLHASVTTPGNDLTLSVANDFGSDTLGNYYSPNNNSYSTGSPSTAALSGTGDFSVEAEVQTGSTLGSFYICSQGKDNASNADIIFELGLTNSGVLFQCYHGATQTTLTGAFATVINTTYHVVVTYLASSGLMTAYLNGTSVGSTSLGGTRNNPSPIVMNIGTRDGSHIPTYEWNGKIYFVRVYNRTLSSGEVNARYNNL